MLTFIPPCGIKVNMFFKKEVYFDLMVEAIREIKTEEDAKVLSAIILASFESEELSFNPYRAQMFKHPDGTITFLGVRLRPEEAPQHIAAKVWQDRRRLNREIKKWKLIGPHVVNCGC